jgi:hypothetical protein
MIHMPLHRLSCGQCGTMKARPLSHRDGQNNTPNFQDWGPRTYDLSGNWPLADPNTRLRATGRRHPLTLLHGMAQNNRASNP